MHSVGGRQKIMEALTLRKNHAKSPNRPSLESKMVGILE